MALLIKVIVARVIDMARLEFGRALQPFMPVLRRMMAGLVMVSFGVVALLGGLLFFLIALFCYLAELNNYIEPALWTGGLSWLTALVLLIFGLGWLKRPS